MFKDLGRRKSQKTDYRQRLGLLKSGKPRLVARRSLRGMLSQLVNYEPSGDKVVLTTASRELAGFGWLGGNNVASSYLTGFLMGMKAKEKGIAEAVFDMGLQVSTKGNRLYAFLLGCNDAGLSVPMDREIAPGMDRISGKHIAEHAKKMKAESAEKHNKYFSSYIKKGLDPERIPAHFEEVKGNIAKKFSRK
jgi:large subunit ribosomal protein L18